MNGAKISPCGYGRKCPGNGRGLTCHQETYFLVESALSKIAVKKYATGVTKVKQSRGRCDLSFL